MEEFTNEERGKYLRFVWGRSVLPSSPKSWERKHRINWLLRDKPDDFLPMAHTCFFALDLPQYTNKQTLREKLTFAITHGVAIDADDTTVARQAAAGGLWLED